MTKDMTQGSPLRLILAFAAVSYTHLITVKAGDAEGPNNVKQGDNDFVKDEGDTVITGKSDEHTVTIDTSEGNVDVTFDDLKIDASDKGEAAVRVEGNGDVTIELDGDNELKSGGYNAGLEKDGHRSEGTLTINCLLYTSRCV